MLWPHSTVTLSVKSIVALAQTTVVAAGYKCEWGNGRNSCQVTLACWEALRKHYNWHIQMMKDASKKERLVGNVKCPLPRCSAQMHNSLDALRQHIEVSHMSRMAVACPINGCCPSAGLRMNTVIKHFQEEHSNFEGMKIILPSSSLKLSWCPVYPGTEALEPLLPLPPDPKPGTILVDCESAPAIRTKISPPPSLSTMSATLISPRKRPHQLQNMKIADSDDEPKKYDFDPLPVLSSLACQGLMTEHIAVRRRTGVFNIDVSRPQHMTDRPIRETPVSILYDVFEKRVAELERKKNLLSRQNSAPMVAIAVT